MKKLSLLTAFAVSCFAPLVDSKAQEHDWKWSLTPYVWALGMEGDVGKGGAVTAPVDVKFTDAVKELDMAGMLVAEAHNGVWGVILDGAYLDLSADASTPLGPVDVEIEQWLVQGAAVYRAVGNTKTTVDVGAGCRFIEMDVDIGTDLGDADATEGWGDPILVARVKQQFSESVFGTCVADVGGFGVSSDLTWQLTALAGYSFTDQFSLLGGYRYLDYDYEEDSFVYDMAQSGLMLGLQFRFD